MAVVTIDAKAELAQLQAEPDGLEVGAASDAAKAPETEKAEAKPAEAAAKSEAEDPDDIEGEDGLTPREKQDLLMVQRKDLPQSVHRVIGKRVAQRKAAEEFAAAQYNERRLAEQRAERAERELAELRAKTQPSPQSATTDAPERPERAKFATDQEFLDAMIAWGVDQRLKEKAETEAKAAEQQHIEEMLAIARQKSALVPDFADALQQATALDLRIPPIIYDYMLQTEMGAELSYHLAKNPDVVKSLHKLQPAQQLVTIGKIESTLKPFGVAEPKAGAAKESDGATPSSKSASTNGQRSQAAPSEDTGTIPSRARDTAPVIRPLNGSGAAPAEIDPRDMNTRQMIDAWQRKHGANFSLRKRH
jgi:hypothetical protein